jgi:anionic cell wall polymer biosynthesis LytR-Cps2A-Psr (LCP) family protein
MSGNGMVRSWNDKSALIRHACAVLVVAFLAGGVYVALDFRVSAADERSQKNEKTVGEIKEKLNTLDTSQKIMQMQIENDQRNSAAFQMRTDTSLDRIIQKLDQMQRPAWEDPR